MENQEICAEIILGVDTHLDIHVGVVIDTAGRVLGTLSVGTHNDGTNNCSAGLKHSGRYAALVLKEQAPTVQL